MYKKIMVPLDGSKLAECVLPHLEVVARGCGTPQVVLVEAVEPLAIPYGREVSKIESMAQAQAFETHNRSDAGVYLQSIVKQLYQAGINAKAEVLLGKAAETLTDYVQNNEVDLVIIATHGRSGVSRWIWGSVADRLLRSLCVPVLMIRAPGCVPGLV
jgi:nucleotide-binding universal stress UspA family protein